MGDVEILSVIVTSPSTIHGQCRVLWHTHTNILDLPITKSWDLLSVAIVMGMGQTKLSTHLMARQFRYLYENGYMLCISFTLRENIVPFLSEATIEINSAWLIFLLTDLHRRPTTRREVPLSCHIEKWGPLLYWGSI